MIRNRFMILLLTVLMSTQLFSQLNYKVEQIVEGLTFTEGPIWVSDGDGYLLFSDISENKVYKWTESNSLQVYINPSGNSNGLAMGNDGKLLLAQQGSRQIGIYSNGSISSFISQYKNKKLNSPNDIVVRKGTGSVFFTDPNYGVQPADEELHFYGVYSIPAKKSYAVLLIDSLKKPNGIALSPDELFMYIGDAQSKKVYRAEFRNDTSFKSFTVFASFDSEIDGIKTDLDGNVFVACANEGITVLNYKGDKIGSIDISEKVTNMAWGGKYNNILFVTAGGSVYKVTFNIENPFIMNEYLGRPTDKSITINMLSQKDIELFCEYGTDSLNMNYSTNSQNYLAEIPIEFQLNNLIPNSKYYYRVKYRFSSTESYLSRQIGSFYTQRQANSNFVFCVQADPHLDIASNYVTYSNAMANTLKDKPDFMLDLGDNFMTEKLPQKSYQNVVNRMFLLRHFYDKISHSVPIYFVIGNHEGENGWELDGTENNIAIWNTKSRLLYYPNPLPDGFYTGDESIQPFVGKRENYYSWSWGDALFVVLDPYWYTKTKPSNSKDAWDWTIGKTQFDWLRTTLESSKAKFKFVFCHQVVGGDLEGRGGIEGVGLYEMGGKNPDSSYVFDSKRPGWGKPLHKLFADNGVSAFFHGHDHLFVKQMLDGVIYQLVPQPSLNNYTGTDQAKEYNYNGVIYPNSGHLRVRVTSDSAVVDYVRAFHVDNQKNNQINGKVEYSYTIYPSAKTGVSEWNNATTEGFDIIQTTNPSIYELCYKTEEGTYSVLRITDMNGKVIKQYDNISGSGSFFVDMNKDLKLNSGVYLACLISGKEIFTKKFFVIN